MTTRGEKVETFHGPQGHFANLGSGPMTAHLLVQEGTARFRANRTQTRLYIQGKANTDKVPTLLSLTT